MTDEDVATNVRSRHDLGMGMGMENLIRKAVEDQTAALRELTAVMLRIEGHLAWQSEWMARRDHPAAPVAG